MATEGVFLQWVDSPEVRDRVLTILVLRRSGVEADRVTVTYPEALQVMTAIQQEQQRRTGA